MRVERTKCKAVGWSSAIVLLPLVGILPPVAGYCGWLPAPWSAGTHGPYALIFAHRESNFGRRQMAERPCRRPGLDRRPDQPRLRIWDGDRRASARSTKIRRLHGPFEGHMGARPNGPGHSTLDEPQPGRQGLGGSGVAPSEFHFPSQLHWIRSHVSLLQNPARRIATSPGGRGHWESSRC